MLEQGEIDEKVLQEALKVSSIDYFSQISNEKPKENKFAFFIKKFCRLFPSKPKNEDKSAPISLYKRFGVDVLSILIATNLVSISDPEQKNCLSPQIVELRNKLCDDLGYVIPVVRILDSQKVPRGKYSILVRGVERCSGFV